MIESTFSSVRHCIFLYNEQLVWWVLSLEMALQRMAMFSTFSICRSGINPTDLCSIYEYLTENLFPQSSQNELRGGSLSRSSSRNLDVSSQYGSFITGPLATSASCKDSPTVYVFNDGICEALQLVVYSAFGASLCLLIKGESLKLFFFYVWMNLNISHDRKLDSECLDVGLGTIWVWGVWLWMMKLCMRRRTGMHGGE